MSEKPFEKYLMIIPETSEKVDIDLEMPSPLNNEMACKIHTEAHIKYPEPTKEDAYRRTEYIFNRFKELGIIFESVKIISPQGNKSKLYTIYNQVFKK